MGVGGCKGVVPLSEQHLDKIGTARKHRHAQVHVLAMPAQFVPRAPSFTRPKHLIVCRFLHFHPLGGPSGGTNWCFLCYTSEQCTCTVLS